MNDLIGRTLKGRFLVTARQGEGSMGTVYRGVDSVTGDDVAIKVMRPDLMTQPAMLARFRREATAMRGVCHRNAVQVLTHGIDDGLFFVVMEFVSGVNLSDLVGVPGWLPPERAARIIADICDALSEAHAHGLVHRDIKPANIMLSGSRGETAKLIDFGMAKSRGPVAAQMPDDSCARDSMGSVPDDCDFTEEFELTSVGAIVGSPGYMAPEQWNGRAVDARTDVYACGVVLYELVTGQLPFEADNAFELAALQVRETPEPPHFLNPAVPAALAAVILRALLPSPDARYQTAAQMRDALRALLNEPHMPESFGLEATVPFAVSAELRAGGLLALDRPCVLPDECPPAPVVEPAPVSLPIEALVIAAPRPGDRPTLRPGDRPTLQPSAARRAALVAQAKLLIPLTAAFLALGVILGILLFLPGPR